MKILYRVSSDDIHFDYKWREDNNIVSSVTLLSMASSTLFFYDISAYVDEEAATYIGLRYEILSKDPSQIPNLN